MSNFIFGLIVGFGVALLIGYVANVNSMDEGKAFLKTCPEYRVEINNEKYKLSCENGYIEMSAFRYLEFIKQKESLVNN
ncbi:hypothetical protein AB7360_17310 [Providencia alcalifaciens]|uniref:Uncharacterized protein n=1 Tax=Pectobacterium carotovorum TaxID=554 RepID=A0A0N9MYP9_PECCA|nr:hypothetical protein [Pectobacterium carotovorum]ALG88483.1 Hypothetical protein [Pectobacterium carotovorum]ELR5147686.1 hypothetical protein [Providencia rettgeri]ELR5228203.1 hypothetical protein [Providencia rettgeri]